MCIYLCAKEQERLVRSALLAGVAHFHARGLCNVVVHFLSQLLPYPGLLVAVVGAPKPPPCFRGTPCSSPPSRFGGFIYYMWGSVLFGDSGFYFSAGFDRYSGEGWGERKHLVLFYDMPWRLC